MVSVMLNLLGRLPFGVLYLLSDITRLIVRHIVRYRRRLVRQNLAAAFPEKSLAELRAIERQFYKNFCDYFFETVKMARISDDEMRRRLVFTNVDVIDRLLADGHSVAVYFAHCFNWEWAPSVTLWSAYAGNSGVEFCQVYRPLRNAAFNRWFLNVRARFGSRSLAKQSVARDLMLMHRRGLLTVTGFMSDQKVSHLDRRRPLSFLGRPTEVIDGTAVLVRRLGLKPVYWDMHRLGRGRFAIETIPLDDAPGADLTAAYIRALENTIRRNPANWLWSHNRWKPVSHPEQ